jgi:PAS domain-containing protein
VEPRSDSERPGSPQAGPLYAHQLTLLLDQVPVGVVVLRGPELIYEYVNAAFQALAAPGIPLVGHRFGWRSEVPQLVARLHKVWDTGETWRAIDLPVRFERVTGTPEQAYFSFLCQKVRCPQPPDALLGFVVETSFRVRADERFRELLHAAHERAAELEAVIDTMREGVIAYDRNHRLTLANATAKTIVERIGVDPGLYENPGELARTLQLARADGSPIALSRRRRRRRRACARRRRR